jgi:protein-disulfide isomerase
MKRYLPFIIVAVVALLTLGSAVALYRAKRPKALTITKDQSASATKDAESVHALGPANAPVTLEEFGDFQCPPCGKLSEPLNQLQHDYNPRLRVIFHHFPLINHKHAREAALAAEAAGMQGRFWEMHDLLYREQAVWSNSSDVHALFSAYAGMLRLDLSRFQKDMASDKASARVNADQKQGASIGVKNTPTLFVNNHEVAPTALNPAALRAAVDAALKGAKPSS